LVSSEAHRACWPGTSEQRFRRLCPQVGSSHGRGPLKSALDWVDGFTVTIDGKDRGGLPLRRVRFALPTVAELVWSVKPELAIAANSVSLLMPFVEPYVVHSIRNCAKLLDPPLAGEALAFVRQESQHHTQHRIFNGVLTDRYPGLNRIETWMGRTFRFLEAHTSARFGAAFAAGFETVAFSAARWVETHADDVLLGADPAGASLFLWHLAEEVEHKTVAADVYRAIGGKRPLYAVAMVLSAVLLAWFSVLGTLTMFWHERRLLRPVAHFRMLIWSLTFLFVLLPIMAVSVLPAHDPRDLVDPYRLRSWITGAFDGVDNMGVQVLSPMQEGSATVEPWQQS
jgi:uncharacterized protein